MYAIILITFLIVLYVILARTTYVMCRVVLGTRVVEERRDRNAKVKSMVVIGSGGHTTEMLSLVKSLDPNRYSPRTYIVSTSDKWSEQQITTTESSFALSDSQSSGNNYNIVNIPRSREVHQHYFTSIFSTLYATICSIPVVYKTQPDIILCNGPGTCIPICVIAFMMRVLFLSNNRIVFIESVCRVRTLSLSGKLLLFIADEILVQWPDLINIYPRTRYLGRL